MKYYEYKIDFDNNLKSSTNLKATTHNGSMHGAWVENPLSLSPACFPWFDTKMEPSARGKILTPLPSCNTGMQFYHLG